MAIILRLDRVMADRMLSVMCWTSSWEISWNIPGKREKCRRAGKYLQRIPGKKRRRLRKISSRQMIFNGFYRYREATEQLMEGKMPVRFASRNDQTVTYKMIKLQSGRHSYYVDSYIL